MHRFIDGLLCYDGFEEELIFEEMDPGLSDYMWSHLGK